MSFKFLKAALAGLVLSASSLINVANAGLIIDTNNDSFIDTSTGVEWMDFGINNNQTYNYVASQLGTGGIYEGWALATKDQVFTMWANAFLGLGAAFEDPDIYGPGALKVMDGFGASESVLVTISEIMGVNRIVEEGTASERHLRTGLFKGSNSLGYTYFALYTGSTITLNNHDTTIVIGHNNVGLHEESISRSYSTMLVRSDIGPTEVHEPTTLAIFALGIMGFVFRCFKNQ
ncbi:MAG: PEP-CTERM sorting domain-containing protein [Alteromonadaceae bacterium]|nr:PEP-CTERM sorting domain-containing protein [Alteromonadaceae bacterium]